MSAPYFVKLVLDRVPMTGATAMLRPYICHEHEDPEFTGASLWTLENVAASLKLCNKRPSPRWVVPDASPCIWIRQPSKEQRQVDPRRDVPEQLDNQGRAPFRRTALGRVGLVVRAADTRPVGRAGGSGRPAEPDRPC